MATAKDLHACAVRELAMRRGVYPKFVSSGRMTQAQADREILLMDAIVGLLCGLLPPPAQGSFLPDDS
jgi:hypothetical protein